MKRFGRACQKLHVSHIFSFFWKRQMDTSATHRAERLGRRSQERPSKANVPESEPFSFIHASVFDNSCFSETVSASFIPAASGNIGMDFQQGLVKSAG